MPNSINIESVEVKDYSLVIHAPISEIGAFCDNFKQGRYEFKRFSEKRSLNANRYLWKMCEEIGIKIKQPSVDVYREAVKKVGIFKDFPDMTPENAKTLMIAWGKLGTGWVSEVLDYEQDGDHQVVRCWYGTSVYNKVQMKRILDYLTEDARSVGVETLEDQYFQQLLNEGDTNAAK